MDIEKYAGLMKEIKFRINSINSILIGETKTKYIATNIEFISLELRKILELIALGSLVAHRADFVRLEKEFSNWWNARLILRDIERINPNFYPRPVVEKPSKTPGVKMDWDDLQGDYLTKEEFEKVYEKCGKILHADNPFGSKTDFEFYKKETVEWVRKIMALLSSHEVRLLNDENKYLVHMEEPGDDEVHYYIFEPIK